MPRDARSRYTCARKLKAAAALPPAVKRLRSDSFEHLSRTWRGITSSSPWLPVRHGSWQVTQDGEDLGGVLFGPRLESGDIVTVEVDLRRKTVRFYRNQASGDAWGFPRG